MIVEADIARFMRQFMAKDRIPNIMLPAGEPVFACFQARQRWREGRCAVVIVVGCDQMSQPMAGRLANDREIFAIQIEQGVTLGGDGMAIEWPMILGVWSKVHVLDLEDTIRRAIRIERCEPLGYPFGTTEEIAFHQAIGHGERETVGIAK